MVMDLLDYTDAQKEFLSCKPSRLIEIAIEDLKKCEKEDRYVIAMDQWVLPVLERDTKICYVCLAGAALVQHMNISYFDGTTKSVMPDHIYHARELTDRAHALNLIRSGHLIAALNHLGYDIFQERSKEIRDIQDHYRPVVYHRDKETFKNQMMRISKALAEINL